MSFGIGESVGPYRIIEQLGQGGMATVFKAYHAALDRYVALKVLHPAFSSDPSFEARFQREAMLVAKLEHPHIVPVYDYSEHEGRPYLVMKFIEGETLKARLAKGPLASAEINDLVESIGAGLAYAHERGILHRDIKPSNVLIGTDGGIFLSDFGLARIAQSAESTLSNDMIMGTPQYISPEQARGDKNLSTSTDIYSFGVMLYEMLVGQVPFNADTPFSIIHDHIYSPLPMPRGINPDVPEAVQRVLLKTLAKEPSDRYPGVGSLVMAFKAAWTEAGVPMSGATITLPAVSQPLVGAEPARLKASLPDHASRSRHAQIPREITKRRRPGLILGGILGLCVLFVLFGLVVRSRWLNGIALGEFRPLQLAALPTNPVLSFESPIVSPVGTVTPTEVPAVNDALTAVAQNPKDTQAAVDLALAYWENGNPRLAIKELRRAIGLVTPGNVALLENSGDLFKERNAWIPAAVAYGGAIGQYSVGKAPGELSDNFHEALYRSAVMPEFSEVLAVANFSQVDRERTEIALARHSFFSGDKVGGRRSLEKTSSRSSQLPEVYLLRGEMDAADGNTTSAGHILNLLIGDLSTPAWIKFMANTILTTSPLG